MMKKKWILKLYVFIGLLFFAPLLFAGTIYMQIDKSGNKSYSDSPSPGAQAINVPVPASPPPAPVEIPVTKDVAVEAADAEERQAYTSFYIFSPHDQETFQNERHIIVQLRALPKLQKGDKVQLFLDGKPYGVASESTNPELTQLERGSHQVFAVLLDKDNKILKQTNSITIFVHYAHIPNAPAQIN